MDIDFYGIYFYGHPTVTLTSADSQDSMPIQKYLQNLVKIYVPFYDVKLIS